MIDLEAGGLSDENVDYRGSVAKERWPLSSPIVLSPLLGDLSSYVWFYQYIMAKKIINKVQLMPGNWQAQQGDEYVSCSVGIMAHQESAVGASYPAHLYRKYQRQIDYGSVGAFVTALSFGVLFVTISVLHLHPALAYAIQTIVAVEINFVLNHLLTFRYRRIHFTWKQTLFALGKFHLSRVVTIPLSQVLFSTLVSLTVPYEVAQLVCIAVITIINFIASDRFVYRTKTACAQSVQPSTKASFPPLAGLARVSVIVPVKGSEKTIRGLVESLLSQDYPGPMEIILVGDKYDRTWEAIGDYIAQGKVTILGMNVKVGGRDSNRKRSEGLRFADGEVLVLTDSDMVHHPHWISYGVCLLKQGWHCVGGPIRSADGGFWGTYVDNNQFGAKTPRVSAPYVVTAENFGICGKPSITANMFVTRSLYQKIGGLNETFSYSYEDYQWDWEIVQEMPILLDPGLVAAHHHRQGWHNLLKEYFRAGKGCADFIKLYPSAPLARIRQMQLAAVVAAGILTLLVPFLTVPISIILLLGLGIINAVSKRLPIAVTYPFVTAILALAFSLGMLARFRELRRRCRFEQSETLQQDVRQTVVSAHIEWDSRDLSQRRWDDDHLVDTIGG